jgi:nucleoside-diphosphate kinase
MQESSFFFNGPTRPGKCNTGSGTTLGIIKPHIVTNKQAGAVLAEIATHFHIQCMELFNVDKRAAAEFFEVYRGVVATSEYTGMVDELSSGPCLVLEIADSYVAAPALHDAQLFVAPRVCHASLLKPCRLHPPGQTKL